MSTDVSTVDVELPHAADGAPAADAATRVHLECRAAGAGRTRVLLLHGFPEAAFVWDPLLQRLAPRTRALAPNLRGYAGSSTPVDVAAYRVHALVADVAALIDALGAPIDVVVGHDWGGAVAWALAASRPALLRRLLIVNSPHPAAFLRALRDDPAQQAASAYMNFFCRDDAEQRLAADDHALLFRALEGNGAPWLTPALRDAYRSAWRAGLTGALNYYRASPLRPTRGAGDALHRVELPDAAVTVSVPTTIVWGLRDTALRPELLDGLDRWVTSLTIDRVADASHWIVHEQPDRIAAWIERLLDETDAAA